MNGLHRYRLPIFVGAAVLVGFLLVGLTLAFAAREGRLRRHDICIQMQQVRRVLYSEHTTTLKRGIAFLKKHPDGLPKLGISRHDLLVSIGDERVIVAQIKPRSCSD